ncbi:amidohydrolase family protein [Botrimarina hoheduenensis]|uniref:Guanine deaminase n=1 Tax=Botrimarina hoheduenensis TaxID=2528000 RepID=A0A5C5VSS5_9BACT|nr:amidohydrolase family protein [Botrimarina hoheduenensis]TWT40791.1 Guanine deaminase [Botrimarina hoheduenensis]
MSTESVLFAGQLLLPEGDNSVRLAEGVLRVESGVIVGVDEGPLPRAYNHGGPACLITPGFVDTHVHLPQFDMIGAHGATLLDWLQGVTFPSEAKWSDTDYATAMTHRVADQLIAHGTTAVCAYASVHAPATAAALMALEQRGIGGVVGQALSERFAPSELVGSADELLDQTATLLDRYPPSGRLAAAVTPRFAVSCGEALLAGAGRLAAEHGAVIQTHLSETRQECDLVRELFGCDYVEVYRRAGLLTERSLLGHGIYLEADDCVALRESGSVVAHCPTANSFLRSGAMRLADHLHRQLRVSLGSDIGGGYERSMVRVARAMIETAAAVGESFPTAKQAWSQITAGNASAAGLRDAGVLCEGAPADLLLIEPDVPWQTLPVDPLATLLWSWDDRWLQGVWLRGQRSYASA